MIDTGAATCQTDGMESLNCPIGLDPDYPKKVCRNCGRSIHLVRRSHKAKAYWQHNSDMAGIRWSREARRR